jgi:hypothetical protein
MGIINIFKRGTEQLTSGVDTWVVEWTRRYGVYSNDTEKCFQAFTNKDEAEDFADSIRKAHKLIGNSCWSETQVTVKQQKSGL